MSNYNQRVDEYIANAEDFAKPIMEHLRSIIHDTCPSVEEIIKWGIPHFDYKGDMMCILAAYNKHCSFSLYKAELMNDPMIQRSVQLGQKMGYMDKIKSLSDLPAQEVLVAYIREAMILNENGIKKAKSIPTEKPKEIEVPDYFAQKLEANLPAKAIFDNKSSSYRKEYLIWIADAKTEATRQKRLEQSLEWISEGKSRFWQYGK
jgi:uncharacterized protein YdeI (YjbR/CyaY-like superfamily)